MPPYCACFHTHTHTYTFVDVVIAPLLCVFTHTYTHIHSSRDVVIAPLLSVFTHTYTHRHAHIQINTHIHTHTCAHTDTPSYAAVLIRDCVCSCSALKITRVGQNRIYTPCMTVYLVISLPKIPYLSRIYMVLANPKNNMYPLLHDWFQPYK